MISFAFSFYYLHRSSHYMIYFIMASYNIHCLFVCLFVLSSNRKQKPANLPTTQPTFPHQSYQRGTSVLSVDILLTFITYFFKTIICILAVTQRFFKHSLTTQMYTSIIIIYGWDSLGSGHYRIHQFDWVKRILTAVNILPSRPASRPQRRRNAAATFF